MSPKKQKKLNKIRKKLDNLDDALIKLVKKRTNLVNEVLKLKNKKNQIIDKKRIKMILKRIKIKSKKNKIDPKITNRIWKNMISAYIDFESTGSTALINDLFADSESMKETLSNDGINKLRQKYSNYEEELERTLSWRQKNAFVKKTPSRIQ